MLFICVRDCIDVMITFSFCASAFVSFYSDLGPLALGCSGPRSLWSAVALGCCRSDWSPRLGPLRLLCSGRLGALLGRSGTSLALGPCNRLLSAKLTRFSALGPAHLAKPSRLDLLGSTHSPRPPPSLGPAALSWAQPLHSEPLRSEPSVGPFGSDPSGSNSSARFLDLVLDRSDLRARGSWPLQSSAALGIGVLRRLPVRLVQPLCPARSRLDRSTRFASLRLGLLLNSVPSDRAPSDPTPCPLQSS